jgi:hypothetical protein
MCRCCCTGSIRCPTTARMAVARRSIGTSTPSAAKPSRSSWC